MSKEKRLSAKIAQQLFGGRADQAGLFESMLGFRTGSTSIKGVHMMNDLAQVVLGGAPDHGGDFLCRLIREAVEDEDNSEESLRSDQRFGRAFSRAYPLDLGHRRISQLRLAAGTLLNVDGGMYKPGDSMASSVATHRDLLGFEGFRRFKVGVYLASILNDDGRKKVKELFTTASDPVSRALRPLFIEGALVDKQPPGRFKDMATSPFDQSLGRGLLTLLNQPLSKPTLLRYFALAASLGIVLKILGAGRPHGRPAVLALPAHQDEGGPRPLREQAVLSWRVAVNELDRHLASLLPGHDLAELLWRSPAGPDEAALAVPQTQSLANCAADLVTAMRGHEKGADEIELYWPDEFALALGKRAGCVLPKGKGFGWGNHLALSGEFVEIVMLMFVPAGKAAEDWSGLWRRVREHLGLIIGAEAHVDAETLEEAGIRHVSLEELSNSAEVLLNQAVRRGVARKLPDSGAEAGGALQ